MKAGIIGRVVGEGCWRHGCCLRTPGILITSTSDVLNVEGLLSVLMKSFLKREVGLATNMCKVGTFDCIAKIGRRWLSEIANAEASIFII